MTWHQHERETLADLLRAVGSDAPTLCEGWRSRHLAVHLAQRESAPWESLRRVPGPVGRYAQGTFENAADACRDPEQYARTIDRFAAAPAAWTPWGFAGDSVNLLEFFVHGEDVRRAGALDASGAVRERPAAGTTDTTDSADTAESAETAETAESAVTAEPAERPGELPPPRDLSPDERDTVWQALRRAAPLMLVRVPAGLVYVRDDGPRALVHRPREGHGTVVLRGDLGDLVLHAFGRGARTRLVVEGDPADVAAVDVRVPLP